MSVHVTVDLIVSGTDDGDAVEEAMFVRDRYYWPEIADPVFHALQEAGIDAFVEVDSISYESVTYDLEPMP